MRASLSQETIQTIFELSQQRWSARQIAQELDIGLASVHKYLNSNTADFNSNTKANAFELNPNTPKNQSERVRIENEHPEIQFEHQSERVRIENERQNERVRIENQPKANAFELKTNSESEHPNPLLTAAIKYATAGWQVIPLHSMVDGQCSCGKDCGSPAKHPITRNGLKDATTDTSLVKSWWQRWPNANVGVVTGEASGIVVLDVDSYKGGMESLSALWLGQPTENIPQAMTGGGGRHLFFRHPGTGVKIGNRCEFMPGLDIRGDGGYIVAPPSNHASGRVYEWNDFTMPSRGDLADPKGLMVILERIDSQKARIATPTQDYSPPQTVELTQRIKRASAYLKRIEGAVSGQGGHDTTWDAALVVVRGFDLPEAVAYDLLATEYNPRCQPPWSERELRHKVESATRDAQIQVGYLMANDEEWRRANGRVKPAPKSSKNKATGVATGPNNVATSPDFVATEGENAATEGEIVATNTEEQGGGGAAEDGLPEIITSNRQLREIIKESWDAVMAVNDPPKFFYHGGSFSALEMSKDAPRAEDNILIIQHLSRTQMYGLLLRLANWMEYNKKGNLVNSRPPKEIAPDMVEIVSNELPVLDGLIHAPVFNYDGVVIDRTGYDPISRLYLAMPESLDIPATPYNPTPEQLTAARDLILEIFCDFPFEDQADKANAISLLLLPFCRRMIRGCTPLHLITAPSPRTGKSLLGEVVSSTLTGTIMQGLTLPSQDDEVQKTLLSKLMEARPIILIDNIDQNKTLNSPSLASYLTMPMPEGRLLGSNTMIRAQNNAVWIATGNNPKLSTEIAGRCVRIRIDSKTDRPEKRTGFLHHPLTPWVKANRGRIISACLTIIHAWVRAGQPRCNSLRMGGFDDWVAIMGGILQVAGIEGFMTNSDKLFEEADAEGAVWREFVAAWREEYQDRWCSSRDLASLCRDRGLMGGIMGDGSEKSQDTRMGGALRRIAARVYDGYQIVSSKNSKTKREQYRLVQIDGQTDKVAPGETRGLL